MSLSPDHLTNTTPNTSVSFISHAELQLFRNPNLPHLILNGCGPACWADTQGILPGSSWHTQKKQEKAWIDGMWLGV